MTSSVNWSFSKFFFIFFFFYEYLQKNSKTSKVKPTDCIKSLNILSFSKKSGQDNHF